METSQLQLPPQSYQQLSQTQSSHMQQYHEQYNNYFYQEHLIPQNHLGSQPQVQLYTQRHLSSQDQLPQQHINIHTHLHSNMLPVLEIPSRPTEMTPNVINTALQSITQKSNLPVNMGSILSRLPEQLAFQLLDFTQTNTANKAKVVNYTPTTTPKRVRKIPKRKRKVVAECCAWCSTNTTPEWRRGPYGKNTLCNACGLKYAKGANHDEKILQSKRLKSNALSKQEPPN